jgi:hypothetical protein
MRFMRFPESQLGPDADQAELSGFLKAGPGIRGSKVIGPHPKGGYTVKFDLASDTFDTFISYLAARGWRPVI